MNPEASASESSNGATQDGIEGVTLIDVRRAAAYAAATTAIPGSEWRDPANVDRWAGELSTDEPVVVYCVAGHEVSQGTASRLRVLGHDARFLIGGIEGWEAAGRPLVQKQTRSN